jgi:hypothetical protein
MNFFTKSHNTNDRPDIAIEIHKDSMTTYLPEGNHSIVCVKCNKVLGAFKIERGTELISCVMKCENCSLHTIAVNIKTY